MLTVKCYRLTLRLSGERMPASAPLVLRAKFGIAKPAVVDSVSGDWIRWWTPHGKKKADFLHRKVSFLLFLVIFSIFWVALGGISRSMAMPRPPEWSSLDSGCLLVTNQAVLVTGRS